MAFKTQYTNYSIQTVFAWSKLSVIESRQRDAFQGELNEPTTYNSGILSPNPQSGGPIIIKGRYKTQSDSDLSTI